MTNVTYCKKYKNLTIPCEITQKYLHEIKNKQTYPKILGKKHQACFYARLIKQNRKNIKSILFLFDDRFYSILKNRLLSILYNQSPKHKARSTSRTNFFQGMKIKNTKTFIIDTDVAICFQLFNTSNQGSLCNTQHISQLDT